VEVQGHVCLYCGLPFGTIVEYRGETTQTPVGDHFIPWSLSSDTSSDNLVVCCQVCNTLKSDTVFRSVEEATRNLLVERMKRGVRTLFIPQNALTFDPEGWNREAMGYFSSSGF